MLDSVWLMLYGKKLMQEIVKYDVSASTLSIECDGRKLTTKSVYGICKNGFALYATHVVDMSNPLKDMDVYVALMVNHNKSIKLPKSKVITNKKFAKRMFDLMHGMYQNPVKLYEVHNAER